MWHNEGRTPWNKGKKLGPLSKETRNKISKKMNGCPSHMKGKTWEEISGEDVAKERKQLYSERKKGNIPHNKDKSYEECYGKEKAERIREKLSKRISEKKGKTYEEIYGVERAKKLKEGKSLIRKGKTWEEIYGKEKADEWREKQSKFKHGTWEERFGKEKAVLAKQKLVKSISGENHHHWLGGSSYFPYPIDFNRTLKNQIKERDNYICQMCGKCSYVIHHIDYNKDNCDPTNLVTLCSSCHSKTNFNRLYWKEYFSKRQKEN